MAPVDYRPGGKTMLCRVYSATALGQLLLVLSLDRRLGGLERRLVALELKHEHGHGLAPHPAQWPKWPAAPGARGRGRK